jgi:hypothetical protein
MYVMYIIEFIYTKYRVTSNITIIQCYAPTEAAETEKKNVFYQLLNETLKKVKRRNNKIMMGDMNAQIGPENEGLEHVIGRHGIGNTNKNGERLIDLCTNYELVISETVFPHKECHKVTWVSPDHRIENQIDHMAIDRKFRRSLIDVQNK